MVLASVLISTSGLCVLSVTVVETRRDLICEASQVFNNVNTPGTHDGTLSVTSLDSCSRGAKKDGSFYINSCSQSNAVCSTNGHKLRLYL